MKLESAVFELSAALASQLPSPTLPEVAFSGRSNVGKSTLINTLLRRKTLARVSATPGKTATINFYRLDTLRLVDLPGYGYAQKSMSERKQWGKSIPEYLEADRDLRLVIQLVDMRHPPTADDRMMLDYLVQMELPFILVLTKADKLNKTQRAARMEALKLELSELDGVTIVPFSSVTGEGTEQLREIIRSVCESD